ncbi:MAG: hypothetical protein FWF88_10910 [Peptococcaceae bacterium]|nr:hypothetical protein [Peptococcaceae bacterium]
MVKRVRDSVVPVFKCGLLNIRKWAGNPRVYIIVFLLGVFLYTMLENVRTFCMAVGRPVTPWIFPFLMDNTYVLFFLMTGVLLLFCDAPFIDAHQPNLMVRAGKKSWALGQVFYIGLASALYFIAVFVVTNVLLLPYVGLSADWGKVLGTLAQTSAGSMYDIGIGIDYHTMLNYTPPTAIAWSFLLAWLVAVFLGLVSFVVNQSFSRGFGTVAVLFLIFMPWFVSMVGDYTEVFALNKGGSQVRVFLHYFSPVSWAGLNALDLAGDKPMPSRRFAVFALVSLNVVLSWLAVWTVKRKSVDVLPPV